jgi:putative ABC transport system substrate-binding protein
MGQVRRRQFLTAAAALLAAPQVRAQVAGRSYTIGLLTLSSRAAVETRLAEFKDALRERGFAEGRNVRFEHRFGDYDFRKLERLAGELVRLKVDVIFAPGTWAVHGARAETSTIPIVFATVNDPVEVKFVESLARPGRNVTGVSIASVELTGKRLEILKDAFPNAKRVGVLYNDDLFRACRVEMKEIDDSGRKVGLEARRVSYAERSDIVKAFDELRRMKSDAVLIPATTSYTEFSSDVVLLSATAKLPTMYEHEAAVEAGGLMSYGPDYGWAYRRAAYYVARILNGSKPSDLPVERPDRYHLVVNLKTARALGITIPPAILQRADRVIE